MRIVPQSLLALAVAAVAVSACSKDNMAPTTPVMSQTQAEDLASNVVTDVADEIGTATMDGAGSGSLGATSPVEASATATNAQCMPAVSPTPVVNSDSDWVPDSVRFDFAGCVITHPLSVDSVSGTIDLIDPTPLVNALGSVTRGLSTKKIDEHHDIFPPFLFAGFMLLVIEATIATRRRRAHPEEHG